MNFAIGMSIAVGTVVTCFAGPYAGFAAGAGTYAMLQIYRQLKDDRKASAWMKANKYISNEFEGKKVLGKRQWGDKYFGGTYLNTISGGPAAVYAPVRAMGNKYEYEGYAVLAPSCGYALLGDFSGEDKNSNMMMGFYDPRNWGDMVSLDYFGNQEYNFEHFDHFLTTRSLLWISDFDDEDLGEYIYNELYDKAGDEYYYTYNSLSHLATAISEITDEKHDTGLDVIMPYTVGGAPILQFSSSEDISIPEFYGGYPLFVSEEDYYDGLRRQYTSIFVVFEEGEDEYRLIPRSYPYDFNFEIDCVKVHVQKEELFGGNGVGIICTLKEDDDEFTFEDEKLILTDDGYDTLESKLKKTRDQYGSSEEGELPRLILEVRFKKYRSIEDKGDLSSEEVERIAAMQAIEASILEYTYQYNLAQNVEEQLCEIAYTIAVTAVSTLITCGFSAYGNAGKSLAKEGTKITVKTMAKQVAKEVAKSIAKEVAEEILLDPIIEADFELHAFHIRRTDEI